MVLRRVGLPAGSGEGGERRWHVVGAEYSALCVRCLDGDSIKVRWADDLLEIHGPWRVRIARMDAPELGRPVSAAGLASWEALKGLVWHRVVVVIPRLRWPDLYGRMIADVRVDGRDVANLMMSAGFAVRYVGLFEREQRRRMKGAMPTSEMPTSSEMTP